jgi:hypothetical protein
MQRFAPPCGSRNRRNQRSHCCDSSRDLFYGSRGVLRKEHEITRLRVSASQSGSENLDIYRRCVGSVTGLMAEPPRCFPQRFRYGRAGLNR